MAKKPQYNNDSIVALKEEQRVRQKPAVIFGSDGVDGCEHAVFEIVSNSVDEAREGYGDKIIVTRFADKSVEVQDFGRGLPVDYNNTEKRYNWELVFCEMYAGGKYKNGAVTLSTRTLGDFCVVADTVPPRIEPRFKAGEPIRTRSITFRLRDNFSGIGSYTATLDGEWILLERNPMQGTITHTFDESRTPKGRSYTLQLTVTDNCGNKTVWKRTITR